MKKENLQKKLKIKEIFKTPDLAERQKKLLAYMKEHMVASQKIIAPEPSYEDKLLNIFDGSVKY